MPGKEVVVEFIAKTAKLLTGFRKVERKTNTLTRSFRRLGTTLVAAFGARALFRGFTQTIKSTETLIKTAKGVGFAANEYQRLTFSLSQVGVEASAARIALGDFQKRLAKPQFHKFFRQAGLDPKALQKLSPAAAFETAFDHLATLVDDPRAAGFFGTIFEEQAGKNMLQAARSMGSLLQARRSYDRTVGKGLTRQDADSIEETGRQTRLLNLQWTDLKQKVVIGTLPALNKLLSDIAESDAFPTLAKDMVTVIEAAGDLIGKMAKLREALGDGGPLDKSAAMPGGRLKTPGGEQTPQQAAEFAALAFQLRKNRGELVSTTPSPNAGNVSHFTIWQTFNNVREKDTPAKTKQAVESTMREVR